MNKPAVSVSTLVFKPFPDALAPVGHRVRLSGQDYVIVGIFRVSDGEIIHVLSPC